MVFLSFPHFFEKKIQSMINFIFFNENPNFVDMLAQKYITKYDFFQN